MHLTFNMVTIEFRYVQTITFLESYVGIALLTPVMYRSGDIIIDIRLVNVV